MSAPAEAPAKPLDPLRCPACGGDKTLCTWVSPDEEHANQLDVRRRCAECGQGYQVVYVSVSITPTGVVR